jgi:hypothetical protein
MEGSRPTSTGSSPLANTMDRSRRLGRVRCSFAASYDYSALTANEIDRQRRQLLLSILCPAVFNRDVLSLNITCFDGSPEEFAQLIAHGMATWAAAAETSTLSRLALGWLIQRNEILRSQSGERPRGNGEDTATTAL